jgi:hypothetical protein
MKTFNLLLSLFSFCIFLTACHKDPVLPPPPPVNKVPVVQLAPDKSVQIKTQPGLDTIQLTGSASDSDGTITSYLWSQVSGPNSSVIQNPGSQSTVVSGLIAGTYIFQLSATDNGGATGTKSINVSVTVIARQKFTLSLSPIDNPDESLIAGNSSGDFTSPHFTEIDASTWTINGQTLSGRGAFKFDMTSIPAGVTIDSAKLSLFSNPTPLNGNLADANFGTSNAMYIRRITSNWNINTTWGTQPSTEIANQINIPQTNQSRLDLIDVDVTTMVSNMYTDTNYGFMLQLQNEILYNSRIFCSSYYTDATKHPKLVINYSK